MQREKQIIYIAIDDSGKLSKKEKISSFGGIIFLSVKERDKFITQYKSIVNDYKCRYCKHKDACNNLCPELKHYNLKPKHKRRFINYLKKYILMSCTIENNKIYKNILNDAKSKGRFMDYAIKMMIKEAIKNLIKEKKINPYNDIEIILNIDESSYKSNGYYNLENSIYEELKHGMKNIKNNTKFKNIIYGKLTIKLNFKNSYKCYLVQAADLIAGTSRKISINFFNNKNELEKKLNFINYKIYLP